MTDRTVTLSIVLVLGVVAVATVIGGLVLAMNDKSLPEAVIAIGSGAVGAIGGLLARSPLDGPQDVNVVNRAADPVPVDANP